MSDPIQNFDQLRVVVLQLNELLADPQPGLVTYMSQCSEHLRQIADFWQQQRAEAQQLQSGDDLPVATTPKERAVVQCWDVFQREELSFADALQVCCCLIGNLGQNMEAPKEARDYAIKKILEVLP